MKAELLPLEGKHYETVVIVWVDNRPFKVSISGEGSSPSERELEVGYTSEEGMNHVESLAETL